MFYNSHCEGGTAEAISLHNISKLVYYEIFNNAPDAIAREKQIKAGSRKKKELLIKEMNPGWKDLYETFF